MSYLQELLDRYVIKESQPREQLYRQEASRIRAVSHRILRSSSSDAWKTRS